MGGRVRLATLVCLVVGVFACAAAPALADSPLVPNTNWTALLPPLSGTPTEPQPGPVPNCEVPSVCCVDTEIQRMTRAIEFRNSLSTSEKCCASAVMRAA